MAVSMLRLVKVYLEAVKSVHQAVDCPLAPIIDHVRASVEANFRSVALFNLTMISCYSLSSHRAHIDRRDVWGNACAHCSKEKPHFTVLCIFTRGHLCDYEEIRRAVVDAARHAMSIIIIGIGIGVSEACEGNSGK